MRYADDLTVPVTDSWSASRRQEDAHREPDEHERDG